LHTKLVQTKFNIGTLHSILLKHIAFCPTV